MLLAMDNYLFRIPNKLLDTTINGKTSIYIFLIVATLIFSSGCYFSIKSVKGFSDKTEGVIHSYEVRLEINELAKQIYRVQWQRDPIEFQKSAQKSKSTLDRLSILTKDNFIQQQRLQSLKQNLPTYIYEFEKEILQLAKGSKSLITRTTIQQSYVSSISALLDDISDEESRLLSERQDASEISATNILRVIALVNIAGFSVLIFAFWLLKRQNAIRSVLQQKIEQSTQVIRNKNAELIQLNASLEQRIADRTRELESFSFSVSHDLRAPLRAIDGYGLMLEEDHAASLNEEGLRFLATIRSSSKHMGQLIDDLLAFSRLGRQAIAKESFDMTVMVKEVCEEFILQEPPRPLKIDIGELASVAADRALLHQVWVNLISNAIKYSSKVAVPIISIKCETQGNDIEFSIRDNGTGFNMEYYNKLFEVFHRLHHADDFPGTGVGLAIVRSIIVRHGGRVWAEGKDNVGAVFYFTLPRSQHG